MTGAIIDAHHHIWELQRVPWLAGPMQPRIFGTYAALRRDYLAEEFRRDALACGVTRSVYIQINVAPGDEVAEVDWVQDAADRAGLPSGIVAFADLAAPNVGTILDRELEYRGMRGIRQQIHWHANPQYRFAPRPDLMNDPAWRAGLAEVQKRGLSFDLQVFPGQFADAARLVRDFPELNFVLLHAGMLEDRSDAGWRQWRRGMRDLAACPNLMVKLSGLGTFVRACSVESWRPVVEQTIALFTPQRCIFGSNYPIESLWTGYAQIVETMQECLADLSSGERRLVLHDNAARYYRRPR
jgi:predicted TIM-barrel fold metal-dependent hydrolase